VEETLDGPGSARVVVIGEDDEAIGQLVRDAIRDELGFQTVVVRDGAMVMETVRQVHADLVILDINLPGLTGIEIYDRIREDRDIRNMPVLFLSALGDRPEIIEELGRRSITDIVPKPFELNDLLEHVRKLCPSPLRGQGRGS
jgi:two-component system sensor histidine kinase/response regulator